MVRAMPGLRVLFIGGTGIISSACSRLAVASGAVSDKLAQAFRPGG